MKYNPELHHRHSIRFRDYDYSQDGLYFITICIQDHVCLFGRIINGEMFLNKYGEIVQNEWLKTGELRKNVQLHEYVVMPNHFHGIIEITNVGALRATPPDVPSPPELLLCDVGALRATPLPVRPYARTDNKNEYMSSISPKCGDLATIVRAFKSATTKQIKQMNSLTIKKIWQRNYYESIIRQQDDYVKASSYIINNPRNWGKDKFYIK